jgi:hypothetical protein
MSRASTHVNPKLLSVRSKNTESVSAAKSALKLELCHRDADAPAGFFGLPCFRRITTEKT